MRRKLPLSLRILLGLGLGVLAGLALQNAPEFAAAWIQPFGTYLYSSRSPSAVLILCV